MATDKRQWHKWEDALVCEHYAGGKAIMVQEKLGASGSVRSTGAIAQRAQRLGIRGRNWTGYEDWVLRQCYRDLGPEYCRRYMRHRSEVAIMTRAKRLGILRDRSKLRTRCQGDHIAALACLGIKYRGN